MQACGYLWHGCLVTYHTWINSACRAEPRPLLRILDQYMPFCVLRRVNADDSLKFQGHHTAVLQFDLIISIAQARDAMASSDIL